MALHGPLMVNDTVIGMWTATRVSNVHENVLPADSVSDYSCRYSVPGFISEDFIVQHRYGDGPAALAVLVLTRGDRLHRHPAPDSP